MSDTIKIGEMVYKITGDSSGLKAELKKVQLQAADSGKKINKGFGGMLKKMFVGLGVVAAGSKIVSYFKDAALAASDAEETANKFGVVYRDIAATANATANDIAKSFGVAKTESKKLLADTGDLLTGFGFTQDAALSLSNQVVRLGLDLSSFANVDQNFAVEGLRKALLGETEQAKSLGIVINQTTKEFRDAVKAKQAVTGASLQQAKAMVILETATKQSKNAIGDFARSQDSFANKQKVINARIRDAKEAIGKELLPALKLYQDDLLDFAEDDSLGKNMGEFVAKALIGFRLVRDSLFKWINEIGIAFAELLVNQTSQFETFFRKVGLEKFANEYKKVGDEIALAGLKAIKAVDVYSKRLKSSEKAWNNIGKNTKEVAKDSGKIVPPAEKAATAAKKQADAWKESKKAIKENIAVAQMFASQVTNILSGASALTDALYQKRIDNLDAQMEAELAAAGVSEETTVEQAQREYDAAVSTGDALAIEEKRRALEKATIEEKYAKKRAQLEYKGALASWQLQMATAAIGIPIATMQGLITGWGAGWPLGMVLGPLFAGLAGAGAALQLGAVAAAKPTPPKFAEGGIVPGSSYSGDNVSAQVNSGEMILNSSQQKKLFDIANGGAGGGTVNLILDGTVLGKALYNMTQNGDLLIDAGAITTK